VSNPHPRPTARSSRPRRHVLGGRVRWRERRLRPAAVAARSARDVRVVEHGLLV